MRLNDFILYLLPEPNHIYSMKFLYLILFAILPSILFAQSNYHNGYVIKNNGDTVKGFIDYREWDQSPKSIHFKINKEDKSVFQYNPQDIRKFQITGLETYITYSGLISKNATRFPYLQDDLDTSKKTSTIFLKSIATGKFLTLFYYEDDLKPYYFIAETNAMPVELNYYQYYKYANNQKSVTHSDVYKGQLSPYINKYGTENNTLVDLLESTKYEQSDLKRLVDEINGDTTLNNKKASSSSSSTRFFAGISINATNTRYSQDFGPLTTITKSTKIILPQIHLGMDFLTNPNIQKLVFRGEFSLSYINPKFTFPLNIVNENTTAVYSFNQYTATVTPQILLNVYNKEKFKLYVDVGVGLNLSSYSNKFVLKASQQYALDDDITNEAAPKLQSLWFSFPIQIGVTLNKKVELALTYFGYDTYTDNTNYDVKNSSIGVGFKYLFGN